MMIYSRMNFNKIAIREVHFSLEFKVNKNQKLNKKRKLNNSLVFNKEIRFQAKQLSLKENQLSNQCKILGNRSTSPIINQNEMNHRLSMLVSYKDCPKVIDNLKILTLSWSKNWKDNKWKKDLMDKVFTIILISWMNKKNLI